MARYSANVNVMIKAIEKASRNLVRDFGEVEQLQISVKGPSDFVTAADKRAEAILHEELSHARPGFGFLMEEGGEIKGREDTRWIIDPLDGTANFIKGIPYWCVTVALEQDGEIVAGVTYNPLSDELFWAEKGQGAYKRFQRLRVSGTKDVKRATIGVGDNMPATPIDDYYGKLEKLDGHFAKTRNFGASALDLAYVAAGQFDAYWCQGFQPWDCAAGILLVREAGGVITTIDNKSHVLYSGNCVAGNSLMQTELLKIIK
jgi:myo-inositol-1(or 4)-monophosphatase